MYKADSKIAEEFIDHQEILDTLEYAHNNKSNQIGRASCRERV